jgi:hypothetical protein
LPEKVHVTIAAEADVHVLRVRNKLQGLPARYERDSQNNGRIQLDGVHNDLAARAL